MRKRKQGKFIVIEGTDGSGKMTQLKLLTNYLRKSKYKVKTISFPQYTNNSAYFLQKYLRGDYGSWQSLDARLISMFYALDRFDASSKIKQWLEEGNVVLADRYVGSNLGHQGARFDNAQEWLSFISWMRDIEYNVFKIPKPDLNVFLYVPFEISLKLLRTQQQKDLTLKGKLDILAKNKDHLRRASASYLKTASLFPKEFAKIDCAPEGKLRSIKDIHADVVRVVSMIA